MTPGKLSTDLATASLVSIAALHVAWGFGSTWPLSNREAFNEAVIGRDAEPSAGACFAVAGALVAGAALVSGRPEELPWRRPGAAAVVAVLGLRGALGLAGRTDLAVPGSVGPRFRRLDRRWYGPLCLALAALSVPATRAPS